MPVRRQQQSLGTSTPTVWSTGTINIGWNSPGLVAGVTYCVVVVANRFDGGGTLASICALAFYVPPTPFCAVPQFFVQNAPGQDKGNGTLYFPSYSWTSSSGDLADLQGCLIQEKVTYPGYVDGQTTTYTPPLPFPQSIQWNQPTLTNLTDPTTGAMYDTQSTPAAVGEAIVRKSFNASQMYRWSCPCFQSGAWQNFLGAPLTITRTVDQDASQNWYFQICKPNIPPVNQGGGQASSTAGNKSAPIGNEATLCMPDPDSSTES